MAMNDSILESVKLYCLVPKETTIYDAQIITFINSELNTVKELGVGPLKGFSIEELCSGNLGDIIGKGFFWSAVEKRHKYAIICGKNDDDNFSKLKIRPKGYYGNVL